MTTEARMLLDRGVKTPATAALGNVVERSDIKSSMGPFRVLPGYRIKYPEVVIRALGELYHEYNRAFTPLVAANREWESDYQYCMRDETPTNFAVQIDMVGLPQTFLDAAASLPEEVIRETLRRRIFEIENSLAMYQLLERIGSQNGQGDSFFSRRFRAFLMHLTERFGRPIPTALLAITDQKHHAMRESEFGKRAGKPLSDAEVFELSGFDRFFSPADFRGHVEANGGGCEYLLYVRSSDPIAKLKSPNLVVHQPLLGNPSMRQVIKAHALTFNVDAPEMKAARRINDTKGYMAPMGMAFPIGVEADLLSPEFAIYLRSCGVDPEGVESGQVHLRAKPAKGTYGCYGHMVGTVTDRKFRSKLRRNMRLRGEYVVQPEMETPIITNRTNGMTYTFIDRNFFAYVAGRPEFLGGFRSLMPADSAEAQKGRNHGNISTVHAEITS